ncbi:DUF1570 domain-containing protein [Sphingomonas mesophila]|uniref:DUF1570 domain-containing protein n=1 Tax=Sphingomonas mesophila TaxID=2303576 RepID=UPI000E58C3FD|nr:DUF1570 domain-containing protein [Sphingomonas mesophila]
MRNLFLACFGSVLLALSAPLGAAWHRASTPHFIIYSEEDPERLKAFAAMLERFDAAVRLARGMKDPPVGDGNRLTVFVVKGLAQIQRLKRGSGRNVAGFYLPRASGSIAVVPRETEGVIPADVVFQHEYAHHLMFADLSTPIPKWLVEGFAEFYSTANVEADGSVGLGEAATHRKAAFNFKIADALPLSSLFESELRSSADVHGFYAKSWLLTHYLTFAPKRRGQLDAYVAEFARGRSSLDAARIAFGDLRALEQDLKDYYRAAKFPYLTLAANRFKPAAVTVERLGPGAEAAMPLYMRLQSRTEGNPADNAAEARALAAAHPFDALVMMTLAEAEWVAKNYKASETAADRAIALQPQSAEAHIWKGRALLSLAEAKAPGITFANARGWFNRANRLDPENPEPLLYYYRTYQLGGTRPTANAIAALHYAAELAPQDLGLRLESARQHLADRQLAKARRMLVPVAYSPHGGRLADEAKRLLTTLSSAS